MPIAQLVLPNGDTCYFVQMTVGGDTPFDALLDTGSFGLRVLQAHVSPASYKNTDLRRSHPFASGTRFSGPMAAATFGVGEARTEQPVPIQVIDKIECVERRPNSPASKVSPEDFLIAGGGYPGQGARFQIDGVDRPIALSFVATAEPSNRIRVHPPHNPEIMRISAGTLPCFPYTVLYKANAGRMDFKPRTNTKR